MQTFLSPDYLSLAYRSDLNFLVGRWLRPVSGDETRQGYALILQAAQQCACPYWLLDGRRRPPADAETTRWGLEEFFPSLNATFGQLVFMSQLLSPDYQALTDAQPAFQVAEQSPARTYQMRRFNDENQAVRWLQQQQTVPAAGK
ncbi:hypothetical protein CDA63_10935 [Hymenobacter amundsenii]|uniref:STAS/SEC14 domain-containing protein n=1 Tax=Hymenobacter amundsenii TaxID=2006685 RepID=A0A246FN69_9BACT|nr:hypothetical protein [Hymenobacter amundsenii]OWP63043.1 hypothetical protein CDA63_10935 [Hymenobacter amundsenii]